ncbi:hypothetical protein OHC33_007175 [Knufia fluminis]|uniref:Major facilitator superfamily (MFS) profile domain-containing protein n=1 Tax=Knufia fluminis TaxID=191047 RepID=A0AAN8EIW5_9EURO|nr:hypothetical protein OHC33_007175 [Knufia fluminis]
MASPKQVPANEKDIPAATSKPAAALESSVPEATLGIPLQTTTSAASDPYGSRPACFNNLLSECLFVVTTAFAIGQTAILQGVLTVMTSRIQQGLDMNSSEVTWLVAGMSLTSGTLLLFFGRVADLFGRRNLLIYSMASFTIFMLITGFSQNAIMAEIFLAFSGISCASVVPPAIGKLGAIYEKPSRRKNRAFACFSAGNPVGYVLGALIGGIVTNIASWRACFWVVAVIYAFLTVAAWFTTPLDAEQALGGLNIETMKQMDWLGALLAVGGIALFTASFTLAPDAHNGWSTPYVIAMLIVGIILIAAFLYWQSIFKHPLMPLRVWRDRNFSLLIASLCLNFYGFNGNFFWATLGWQRAYVNSPLEVAVKILPAAIGGIIVNLAAALLMHRVSNKLLMMVAAAAAVVSCALWSPTSKSISFWALAFPAQLFAVTGVDIAFCVTNLVCHSLPLFDLVRSTNARSSQYVMSSLPLDQQSVAGGMFSTVTRLASTVGLGISTTVFASAGGTTEVSRDVPWRPYQSTFWVSLVGAVLGLALTPFLTIGKQGHRQKAASKDSTSLHESKSVQEKPEGNVA